MKQKILTILLLITSLFCYLEWSGGNHAFLFESEMEIFLQLYNNPLSVFHPLVLLPLAGQFILLITLFQNPPPKLLSITALIMLALMPALELLGGVLTLNVKTIVSVLPFLIASIVFVRGMKKNQ